MTAGKSGIRVMMLGWEYPPRFAGGLGKACQGLASAMARKGARVFFILPTFPESQELKTEPRLEVVGALERMLESGVPAPVLIRSEARLFPYGAAPEGPAPDWTTDYAQGAGPRVLSASPTAKPATGSARVTEPQAREIYGKNLWAEIERFCFTLRHLAEAHEVDVLHAHDWMTFPAAFEFQRLTGVPVFLHVHATEYDRSGESLNNEIFRIEREGFRAATHIFAVSRYTAGIIERLYGVNRKKISVVYNAPEDGEKESVTSAANAPRRRPQVVFLGRLTFQKGPDHFLKAAELVARAAPEARFLFCGTGDMMDKLRGQAHRLGIEERVHFTGFLDPAGVDQILLRSQVLVMPSVSEPFGLVALEAIRCGIPVIISRQSGVREVLPRALQADFWDHEKLADQILASLRLPDLTRQLVDEGMQSLRALSWEKSAEAALLAYHEHLGSTYASAISRGAAHGH